MNELVVDENGKLFEGMGIIAMVNEDSSVTVRNTETDMKMNVNMVDF
jgi:hypothetical protein